MPTQTGELDPTEPGPLMPTPRMGLTAILTALSGLTFLLALALQWGVLITCGAEARTDALFASLVIPQTLLSIFSVSLGHVLVPLMVGEEESEARRHALGLFLAAIGASGTAALALAASADFWVPVLFPGFAKDHRELAVGLCRIQLLSLVFGAGSGVLVASFHSRRRFVWPELAHTLGHGTSLAVLVATVPTLGVSGAAWAFVARTGVYLALLAVGVGWRRPSWPGRPFLRAIWSRWKPLLAGSGFYKTELVVDSFLSSMSPPGSLSLYYLAQRVYGSVAEILRKSLAEPVLPALSERAKLGDEVGFRRIYRKRIALLLGLLLPVYGALILAGEPVLGLLIGRGGITADNVRTLWIILIALGGVFLGAATGQVVSFAWYARGETKIPTLVGVAGFSAAIAMKIAGYLIFGIVGIAMAASLHYLGNGMVLYFLLHRRSGWRTRPA